MRLEGGSCSPSDAKLGANALTNAFVPDLHTVGIFENQLFYRASAQKPPLEVTFGLLVNALCNFALGWGASLPSPPQ